MRTDATGAVRTDLVVAVVLTAAVLGLGLFLGATLFATRTGPAPSAPDAAPPATAPGRAGPTLEATVPPSDLEARLAGLEKAVEAVRSEQAASGERVRPLLDEYERLKAEGVVGPGAPTTRVPGEVVSGGGGPGGDDVRQIARKLGLDAARREAMATQWAQTLAEIEALEKAHAQVSRDGTVTTIRIGKYGDEATGAVRRWRDWVDRSLTPREKEAYERENGDSLLLGTRAGEFERTITLDETGGVLRFQESIATKDGPLQVLQGTAPAEARDLVLEPYDHLLSPTNR
jgi:hypothetical protein